MDHVEIELFNEQGDAAALDEATRSLRYDLECLDVCTVTQPTIAPSQSAKSVDPGVLGQLLVAVVGSGGVAVTVVSVLRDWLLRNRGFKLRLKRDGTEVELEGSDPQQLKEMLVHVGPLLVAAQKAPDRVSGS